MVPLTISLPEINTDAVREEKVGPDARSNCGTGIPWLGAPGGATTLYRRTAAYGMRSQVPCKLRLFVGVEHH